MSAPKFAAVITSVLAAAAAAVLVSPGANADAGVPGSGSAQAQRVDATLADCTITGTDYGEYLSGTDGDDVICGLGGNDTLVSSPGNDTYIGGDGVDGIAFSYTNVPNGVKADLLTGSRPATEPTPSTASRTFPAPPIETLCWATTGPTPTLSARSRATVLVGNGRGDVLNGRGGGL